MSAPILASARLSKLWIVLYCIV